MNLWQDPPQDSSPAPASWTDAVFKISCARLPVDHAYELSEAIASLAPWLFDAPGGGVHPIHLAGSQNGWERPASSTGDELILSKRTRLTVRVNVSEYTQLIDALTDQTLRVGNCDLTILQAREKPLAVSPTLYARHVYFDNLSDDGVDDSAGEAQFIERVLECFSREGFAPTRLLTGKRQSINYGGRQIATRSLLIDSVQPERSLQLQCAGIGDNRMMGCGILIPHKSTAAVHQPEN